MKIMVTGSRGFIGTHVRQRLTEQLTQRDFFDDFCLVEVDCFEERVHGKDPEGWHDIFWNEIVGGADAEAYEDVDVVIHLAAQVGVADSMDDPFRYVMDNTVDTIHMMEAIKESGAKPKIVVASSMSVYGDPQTKEPVSEETPVAPASIYGLTKFDQERLVLMYGELLGFDAIALRFFNVFGPGQALTNPYTGVLANFANWILNDEEPTVYEDGLQTRDFIYVTDVADAVVRCALEDVPSGVYNVCTGVPTTILDAATLMCDGLTKGEIAPEVMYTKRPGDIRHCVGDPSKLKTALSGWEPRVFGDTIYSYLATL